MSKSQLYLLDVEGTTSPLSLVSEQLYPFARKHLKRFIFDHIDEAAVRADLALLVKERMEERDTGAPAVEPEWDVANDAEPGIAYMLWLMDRDRKSTALKSLQGKIWKAGFEAGVLVGTVFPDVPEALARWSRRAKVAVYSSGSVEAQRLLFGHSSAGDLTPYLSGYFDTRVGSKTSAESYRAIAAAADVPTREILFVSDAVRELDAAREAGCLTRLSLREGNPPVADANGHAEIRSFAEIG
jgi:enolase-phosphatase E1